nr:hypothetical protein [Tanacetum cinerariifolium]
MTDGICTSAVSSSTVTRDLSDSANEQTHCLGERDNSGPHGNTYIVLTKSPMNHSHLTTAVEKDHFNIFYQQPMHTALMSIERSAASNNAMAQGPSRQKSHLPNSLQFLHTKGFR